MICSWIPFHKKVLNIHPWNMICAFMGQHISNLHIPPELISRHFHIWWIYPWLLKLDPSFPPAYLRLVLWIVMGMPPGSIVTLGCDCSSWTVPARGTSMRNFINPNGNLFLQWVRKSNCMVSRNLVWEVKWRNLSWDQITSIISLCGVLFEKLGTCQHSNSLKSKDYFGMSTLCSGEFSLCCGTTTKFLTTTMDAVWMDDKPCHLCIQTCML